MAEEHITRVHLTTEDYRRLLELRRQRPSERRANPHLRLGQRVADCVAATVGSWHFIIAQSVILALWIALNVVAFIAHWDPYPFILLNLILSFQAAYTAPIIMMSQNRQYEIDHRHAEHDYHVNVKAELEIELLHQKIDMLREQEMARLLTVLENVSAHLAADAAKS